MLDKRNRYIWFITGSQHLYGEETIDQAARDSRTIAEGLTSIVPTCSIRYYPVLTTPEEILRCCLEANANPDCIGLIVWMHTFSPAKMWISGLSQLRKPLLHLHTQFNRDIPWESIDMDFMNLNQSAHGDREFGYLCTRMRVARKVVAGHWESEEVRRRIGVWIKAAMGYSESLHLKIARFGDNMRDVAVTEGDKVDAQIRLGISVNTYGVGELVKRISEVGDTEANQLFEQYAVLYELAPDFLRPGKKRESLREQARIELGMRSFLEEGSFGAFTTTFEDLYGLKQLPGLAVQRLMADGYGFGAEGDWKTAALVRVMKTMTNSTGTSFMEDYTYHLEPGNELVLGAHMLEVCPTLACSKPRVEVHPLSIGGKDDPARLIFNGRAGPAVLASLVDMGDRLRLIVNEADAVSISREMPRLPVARVLWKPHPSLQDASEAWILAGGAHHTGFSLDLTAEHLIDFAEMAKIETILINSKTELLKFKSELQWSDAAWRHYR